MRKTLKMWAIASPHGGIYYGTTEMLKSAAIHAHCTRFGQSLDWGDCMKKGDYAVKIDVSFDAVERQVKPRENTHPDSKRSVVTAFIGSGYGAADVIVGGKVKRFSGDKSPFDAKVLGATLMKNRDNKAWKKVRITVEVIDDGE